MADILFPTQDSSEVYELTHLVRKCLYWSNGKHERWYKVWLIRQQVMALINTTYRKFNNNRCIHSASGYHADRINVLALRCLLQNWTLACYVAIQLCGTPMIYYEGIVFQHKSCCVEIVMSLWCSMIGENNVRNVSAIGLYALYMSQ